MRWIFTCALPCLAMLTACGGSTPPAQSPASGDKSAASEASGAGADKTSETSSKDPDLLSPGNKDSGGGKASPCGGSDISDLAAVLAQSACEAKGVDPTTTSKDL